MATIVNQNPDEENPQNQQGQPQAETGVIPITPGGMAAAAAPGTPQAPQQNASGGGGSGRFVNLQRYIKANQGAGGRMAGDIGKQVGKSQQQLSNTLQGTQGFQNSIQQEQQRLAQANQFAQQIGSLVQPEQQAQQNASQQPPQQSQTQSVGTMQVGGFIPYVEGQPPPSQEQQQQIASQPAAPDLTQQLLSNKDAITQLRLGQTQAGDIESQAQNLFGQGQQQLGTVQQQAAQAATEPGRFELLRQTYNRPTYTRGQQRLDQVLLQNTGGGQVLGQLQKGLAEQAKTSAQQLQQGQEQVQQGLGDIRGKATEAQNLIQQALAGEQGELQSGLEARRAAQLASLQQQQAAAQQKLKNKEDIDAGFFTQFGVSPEKSKQLLEDYNAIRGFGNQAIESIQAKRNDINQKAANAKAIAAQMPDLDAQIKALQMKPTDRFNYQDRQNEINALLTKKEGLLKDYRDNVRATLDNKDELVAKVFNSGLDPSQQGYFEAQVLPKIQNIYTKQYEDTLAKRNDVIGGIDFSQYLNPVTEGNLTLQNVASDQDYATQQALAQLAGVNPTLLTEQDRAKANTGMDAARAKYNADVARQQVASQLATKLGIADISGLEGPGSSGRSLAQFLADPGTYAKGYANLFSGVYNPTAWQQIGSGNFGDAITGIGNMIGVGSGGFFSDKTMKKDIKKPDSAEIKAMLDKINAYSYNYKDQKNGKGKQMGVMAQDLKKSSLGSQMVDKKEGKMHVDRNKAVSTLLAAVSDLHDRLEHVEKKKGMK